MSKNVWTTGRKGRYTGLMLAIEMYDKLKNKQKIKLVEFAKKHDVSTKTVFRIADTLSLFLPIVDDYIRGDSSKGPGFRHISWIEE